MTIATREFTYNVLTYVPSILRGESINVGVVLREQLGTQVRLKHPDGLFVGIAILEDLRFVGAFDPDMTEGLLRDQLQHLAGRLTAARDEPYPDNAWSVFQELMGYSNSLRFTDARGVDGSSPQELLHQLAETLLRGRYSVR